MFWYYIRYSFIGLMVEFTNYPFIEAAIDNALPCNDIGTVSTPMLATCVAYLSKMPC